MNNDRDQLWNDLLADSASTELRGDMLRKTVGAARSRRRRRIVGVVAAIVAPLAVLFSTRAPEEPIARQQPAPAAPQAQVAHQAKLKPKPEIITDEELFAMFPNHALALIGRKGNQQLVILGERSQEQ